MNEEPRWAYKIYLEFLSGRNERLSFLTSFLSNARNASIEDRARVAFFLSEINMLRGEVSLAYSYFKHAVSLAKRCMSEDLARKRELNLAFCLSGSGHETLAERVLVRCIDGSIRCGSARDSAYAALLLAELRLSREGPDSARELIGLSHTVFRSLGDNVGLARTFLLRGRLSLISNELEDARMCVAKAVEICRIEGIERERAEGCLLMAEILEREGKPREALSAISSDSIDSKSLENFPHTAKNLRRKRKALREAGRLRYGSCSHLNADVLRERVVDDTCYNEGLRVAGDIVLDSGAPGHGSAKAMNASLINIQVPEIYSCGWRQRGSCQKAHERFVTCDEGLINILRMMRDAAASPFPVLVMGETGVGKELVSRLIHMWSGRSGEPFVVFNAASIPHELFDSMIFGHRKGSFTGAIASHKGLIATAGNGTVFIDEIGELEAALQAKLLRLIDLGEYMPLGETRPRRSAARIIAASNRDLSREVAEGRFRGDLFHRISMFSFVLPPLRERRGDIELIAMHFLESLRERLAMPHLRIARAAMDVLVSYTWPGNVRELQAELIRAALASGGRTIKVSHLSVSLILGNDRFATRQREDELDGRVDCLSGSIGCVDLRERLKRLETFLIMRELSKVSWNITKAAERLGLKRTTLISKMKRLGIS